MPRKQIIAPAIQPLLLCAFLVQALVPMLRILTSYRAMEAGQSAEVIGAISAVFALLPVFLTVMIGRLNDTGALDRVIIVGAAGALGACLLFWWNPASLAVLFGANALLGLAQTAVLSGLQVVTARVSTLAHRDAVLGNYMVALSLGQAVGPLAVGFGHANPLLPLLPAAAALAMLAAALVLGRHLPRPPASRHRAAIPLRDIAATRGLWWIILLGSLCVAAQDLLLAFFPIFGVERGLTPVAVGILLSLRAMAAMAARALYGRAVRRLGQMRLALASAGIGGAALAAMLLPLPTAAVVPLMLAAGLGLGLALTCSVALTLAIAPPRARGTALSMRMTVLRLAQFAIPLCAGFAVAPLGAAGTFALSGSAILGTVLARPRGIRTHGGRQL